MPVLARVLKSPALWILIGTILVIAVLMLFKPIPPRSQPEAQTWPVQVREAAPEALRPQLRLLGRVESPRTSTLTASVSAGVAQVPVLEGIRVDAGDLLVALESEEAELSLRQAEADLANLQAQIRQEQTRAEFDRKTLAQQESLVAVARRTVEREERLRQSNLTSEARMDEARTSLANAELSLIGQRLIVTNKTARLDALQAQLARTQALRDQAQLDLTRTEIRAPFDGVVTEVAVSPGERVRIGDPITTLYSSAALEVRAQLPQRWLMAIREATQTGESLSATAVSANERYPLTLTRLAGRVNPGAGGVDALFQFDVNDPVQEAAPTTLQTLVLGRTLDIILELPPVGKVISLPVSALYGTNQVFKVVDGHLQGVLVELKGDRFSPEGQEILVQADALATGDPIITTQLPNAVSGLKVEIRNPTQGSGS